MTKDDPIIEPGEDPSAQIAEALADLVQVAPSDRDAWLRARFPDDDFRAELLSLVTHLDSSASNTGVKEDPLTQDADPWIDRLVVGCRIIRLIGSGGMGRVYEARQVGTGRLVAIKLLDQSMASQFLAERLRAEGAALGALKHPNIAHVYQAGIVTADGHTEPYIVMELVRDALDVRQWSTQGSLDVRQRLERLAICCDAIHYGHRQGIIHGDIKPANVLLTPKIARASSTLVLHVCAMRLTVGMQLPNQFVQRLRIFRRPRYLHHHGARQIRVPMSMGLGVWFRRSPIATDFQHSLRGSVTI